MYCEHNKEQKATVMCNVCGVKLCDRHKIDHEIMARSIQVPYEYVPLKEIENETQRTMS